MRCGLCCFIGQAPGFLESTACEQKILGTRLKHSKGLILRKPSQLANGRLEGRGGCGFSFTRAFGRGQPQQSHGLAAADLLVVFPQMF